MKEVRKGDFRIDGYLGTEQKQRVKDEWGGWVLSTDERKVVVKKGAVKY